MYVIKRNGKEENVNVNKILTRIKSLSYCLNIHYVNPTSIAENVIKGLCNRIKTTELDTLAAEISASMITKHYDYGLLAARIAISNLHKETKSVFTDVIRDLFQKSIISKKVLDITNKFSSILDSSIQHGNDYNYNYFGFKTLEKSYLLKIGEKVVERPQYLLMRVAIEIHGENIDKVLQTYHLMSKHYFIHASPTLFNAGTINPQLSSCFLITMQHNDVESIFDTFKQCALISKSSGGIGLAVHNITGSKNSSNGLIPILRICNNVGRCFHQGKRPSAYAIYLEPWHVNIFDFLNLKKNTGNEEERARDLFYALWIPDLFMERVKNDQIWSLMCPEDSPNLHKCWGQEFNTLYEKYENENNFKKQIPARKLWRAIVESQIETGNPFILYKDACNDKSNQKHLGTIQCSNLCTEIIQYSSPDEIAVCNLASIALCRLVNKQQQKFNFSKLGEITKLITFNLNKIIDINNYPVKEAKISNMRHRPIGIGVQGLADTFILMKYPFDSVEARKLNLEIFETIYFKALEASCELAKEFGSYESFIGSPASKGILQYDMWNVKPTDMWDWNTLKKNISTYGLRNSLLVAIMPTASTANILGNNESIEPFTNNIYSRRVLSGDYQIINQYLLQDLIDKNLWNENLKNQIIKNNGSIQDIETIPEEIKKIYRTVWEIPQKHLLQMAIDRAPFIDQSQSLNIYMEKPNFAKISSMHFYGWKHGLKTGMYYLRTRPAANAIQFTVSNDCCLSCSA